MTAHQKLIAHLATLERERAEAVAGHAWLLAETLAACIEETREQIKQQEINDIHEHLLAIDLNTIN